jgi:dTDP-4-amino-4,6-dideoxy-D-galactose acyltransferase
VPARRRALYFLSRADEANTTRLAEDNGFRLVDIRMTFEYRMNGEVKDPANGTVSVRHASPDDRRVLRGIAQESYHDTRYYFDAGFPQHLSDALYGTWLDRSCEGYAQAMLVAELGGVPVGYVSCHLDREPYLGRIGLVGVSSQAQGRGIGQTLVFSALKWFSTQKVPEVRVVTQGRNCAAQRLYQRCGFLTQCVQLWYHKWYPLAEAAHE